jgi:molybdopterin converting factor small subunit
MNKQKRLLLSAMMFAFCSPAAIAQDSPTAPRSGAQNASPPVPAAAAEPAASRDPFSPSPKMQQEAQLPKVLQELSDRVQQIGTELEKQQKLYEAQKNLIEQLSTQFAKQQALYETNSTEHTQLIQQLIQRLDELEQRLSDVPSIQLNGMATDGSRRGAAFLEIDGTMRLVREGDTIDLQPQAAGQHLRSLHIKQISNDAVIVEVGPSRQQVIVR